MGKGGRCVRPTTLTPSCAVLMKSGNLNFLESFGPLQACNGTALHYHNTSHTNSSPTMFCSVLYTTSYFFAMGRHFVLFCATVQPKPAQSVDSCRWSQGRKEHYTCNKKKGRLTGLVMSSSLFCYVTQRRLIACPETSATDSFRYITSQMISGLFTPQ